MVGNSERQCASIVRAVPENIMETDFGFKDKLKIVAGKFNLSEANSIVVGSTLAYNLNLRIGSRVNIAALSGSSDTSLLSTNRQFVVKGIFHCGYAEINSSFAFINSKDSSFIKEFKNAFPQSKAVGWREYNRSYFGVLRMEKNTLFVIVLLIFVVAAINIFNSMKKLVLERKNEIAVLSALGASEKNVQSIFVVQGIFTGILGGVTGLFLGVFISLNMKTVFNLLSKIQFGIEYFFTMIFNSGYENFVTENPMFAIYARIPTRIFLHEVIFIFLFGVFSAVATTWLASRNVLRMTVTEVLRDE